MADLIERDTLKNHLYRAQAEAFKSNEWYVAGAIQTFIDLLDKQPTVDHIADDSKKVGGIENGLFDY